MWIKAAGCASYRKVDEHKDRKIENEILDNYDPHEESNGGQVGGYMTWSEVERLEEENFKADVEVATRRIITEIL